MKFDNPHANPARPEFNSMMELLADNMIAGKDAVGLLARMVSDKSIPPQHKVEASNIAMRWMTSTIGTEEQAKKARAEAEAFDALAKAGVNSNIPPFHGTTS